LSALSIAKEVIQGLVTAFSAVECRMLAEIPAVLYWIVDWTIGGGLLGSIVARVGLRVTIVLLARVHLGTVIIIACSGCCKILQVSDHCSFVRRDWGTTSTVALHTFSTLTIT
jgi:hypothetical protein